MLRYFYRSIVCWHRTCDLLAKRTTAVAPHAGAGSSIPEDSMQQNNMAVHRPTALRVPGRSTQSTSQQAGAGDRGSSSPESSLLVGAVDSVLTAESSLAESSALPEGMSSDSALSACPSGLSAGYSLQSIIGGAVTRFAE